MTPQSLTRRTILAAAAVALVAAVGVVWPPETANAAKDEIYTGLLSGTAVGGFDPVAYFKQGKPVKGSREFSHEWKGASWRFASAENRDAFKANPERYAPQYGGYCAWAVSQGYTAKGDPDYWKIVDGKLYLNYDANVQARWEKDVPGHISSANANWPGVLK